LFSLVFLQTVPLFRGLPEVKAPLLPGHNPLSLNSSITASCEHPLKHLTRSFPSLSETRKEGISSQWAGQWVLKPSPLLAPQVHPGWPHERVWAIISGPPLVFVLPVIADFQGLNLVRVHKIDNVIKIIPNRPAETNIRDTLKAMTIVSERLHCPASDLRNLNFIQIPLDFGNFCHWRTPPYNRFLLLEKRRKGGGTLVGKIGLRAKKWVYFSYSMSLMSNSLNGLLG
jgi:hypothetical protein